MTADTKDWLGDKLPTIAAELRTIESGSETVMDIAAQVDEDGVVAKRITFGKRELQPERPELPDIDRAKARNHEFHSIDAFADYLTREAQDGSSLALADVHAEEITATIDESDEDDREFIQFVATTHPLFKHWKNLIGKSIPVLEFALFVMQYRSAIIEPDGRDLALTFSQIKACKTVTKRVGVGPKSLNGVMVEMMINSEKSEIPVELPEKIVVSAPLFLDTDPVEITLDLLVTDTPGGLVVFVTAPLLEERQFEAFGQFVSRLKRVEGMIVGFGKVQERAWNLLG